LLHFPNQNTVHSEKDSWDLANKKAIFGLEKKKEKIQPNYFTVAHHRYIILRGEHFVFAIRTTKNKMTHYDLPEGKGQNFIKKSK
jgi:hypothetical protein